MKVTLLIILLFMEVMDCRNIIIACSSQKSFVCYDQNRFYTCVRDARGISVPQGYLRSCPVGLICNEINELECEEDLSKEFLVEPNYHFKFGGKEGRKRIIDD